MSAPKMSNSTYDKMCSSFQARIDELTEITMLRLEESSVEMFTPELSRMETAVSQLEHKLQALQHFLAKEKTDLPKLHTVLEAARAHHAELTFIAENLPQHLPGQATRPSGGQSAGPITRSAAAAAGTSGHGEEQDENASLTANSQRPVSGDVADKRKRRQLAPRRYVTQQELAALSSYMTARLGLGKVNAAVDDAAFMAEDVSRLLSAARTKAKLSTAERKRAQALMISIAGKEGVKGQHWFMEADMKQTQTLRPDKTGRALLTVLRHLGRLHEVRLSLEGTMQPVYVLQQ